MERRKQKKKKKKVGGGGTARVGHPQALTTATPKIYCGDLFALSITYFYPTHTVLDFLSLPSTLSLLLFLSLLPSLSPLLCVFVRPSVWHAHSLFIYSFSNLLMFV